jgi:hypothetical protein
MLPAAISCRCGFQKMRPRFFDQRDVGLIALAELVAHSRGELEAARAAANEDDAM